MAGNYVDAERDYMSGMKYKDIATKYGVSINTVKSWKQRYGWAKNKKRVHTKLKKACTQNIDTADGTLETLENDELSIEHQMFCIYYIRSFNATQSYLKVYGCSYEVANVKGPMLTAKPHIKKEIMRLKEVKRQQIIASEEDIVELHMRMAFSDISNYLQFGQKEIPFFIEDTPIMDPDTGKQKSININYVDLKESDKADTQLIQEVKQGKEGVTIKLADKQKSLDWLDKYFLLNPMDKHKVEFDNRKMELMEKEADIKMQAAGKITDGDIVRIVEDI